MAGEPQRGIGRTGAPLALVAAAVLCVTSVPGAQTPPDTMALRVQLLHPALGLYVFIGGGGNTLVFDRDAGLVVVDPKSAGWGPAILKNIEALTDGRVTTVVYSHGHPDHAGAGGEFPDATRIVAHELTARRMAASGVRRGLPTTVLTDRLSLFDRAPHVELYYFGRGHTDGDLVIAFPEADVVHMGDLFPSKAAPVIDVANGGSGVGFPDTLGRAVKELKGFRRVSTGHDVPPKSVIGNLMSWGDLEDYAEFNRVFLDNVREAIVAGLTAPEAAARLRMPEKFKGYDMRQAAANVAAIYKELGH
jgi:glyoxylase-like metal-dependent hydrolase (beta-lactamase superfamily II)